MSLASSASSCLFLLILVHVQFLSVNRLYRVISVKMRPFALMAKAITLSAIITCTVKLRTFDIGNVHLKREDIAGLLHKPPITMDQETH